VPEFTGEKRAATLFFTTSFVYFMTVAIYMPYLSAHYANLGIESGRIGILSSIGSIAAIFVLPIWSRVSDSTGNRRGVLKIIVLGTSLSVLLFLVSRSFWPLFFSIFIFMSFGGAIIPMHDAITINFLSRTSIKFSKVRIGGTIGYSAMLLLSGYIYEYSPSLTFIIAAVSFFVLFLFVSRIPQVEIEKKEKRKLDLRRLFENKRIIFILFIAFCIQVTLSFYFSFIGVYVQELGYTSREIATSSLFMSLSEIPVLLLIDRALRRCSVPAVAIFCGFIMVARLILVAMAQGMGLIYLSQAGNGLSFMALYYCCATFINNEMEEDMKSTGQSILALVQMGFGSIVGNILGGFISQYIGTRYAFLYYGVGLGIICTICAVVYSIMVIRRRRHPHDPVDA